MFGYEGVRNMAFFPGCNPDPGTYSTSLTNGTVFDDSIYHTEKVLTFLFSRQLGFMDQQ